MSKPWQRGWVTRREMEAFGEPVGMPESGPAYGEKRDPITALVGGSVISAGASMFGANKAANAQKDAARQSNDTQWRMYDQTRQDNMPAMEARNASLKRMQELLGIGGERSADGYGSIGTAIDPTKVGETAGYQFGLNQGMNTLERQMNARGMRNSGAMGQAAARYGTDYATTKQGDYLNQQIAGRNALLNPLQSVAGLGQSGASTIAGAGANAANNVSQTQASLGNALGANYIGQGNAINDTLSSLGGWYQNMNKTTQLDGFNGNALTGYTNKTPWAVGPQG